MRCISASEVWEAEAGELKKELSAVQLRLCEVETRLEDGKEAGGSFFCFLIFKDCSR